MWLNVAQIYFFLKGWKVITDFNPVSFIQYISSDQYQLIHDARVFTDFGRWSTVSKFLMKKAWKRLKRIVTVSYTSRNALVSKLGLEESSIVVSYNGCTPNNSSLAPSKKIEKDIDLIYVATYEKRKNHINLIKALKYIDKPMSVCFVGFDNGTKALIESTIANSNAIHSYRLLSDVDDDKLCDLYKRSKLLVYPSFYEGFGMPLIEAASFGCPIACSNLEVFKELLKDYPCYFEPGDPEDIARAITESFNTIIRDVKDFDMSVFNWDVITVRLLQDINMNFRS
ncbi:glycosyltransferase WbpX [Vibrio maritimus]|uniref:Glycosyltransferase WbpX n=1 Tax=Vibrio maritimus TaxID=990268 RepID=A0A090TE26_9VIBR|nr:glycosyltransferase WbpX [Vibrio maritimus]